MNVLLLLLLLFSLCLVLEMRYETILVICLLKTCKNLQDFGTKRRILNNTQQEQEQEPEWHFEVRVCRTDKNSVTYYLLILYYVYRHIRHNLL